MGHESFQQLGLQLSARTHLISLIEQALYCLLFFLHPLASQFLQYFLIYRLLQSLQRFLHPFFNLLTLLYSEHCHVLLQRCCSIHCDSLSLHFGQRQVGIEEETIHNFQKLLILLNITNLCFDQPNRLLKLPQGLP